MSSTPPTGYTTIPPSTSPTSTSTVDFISRTTHIRQSLAAALRPWRELLHPSALSLPFSFSEATYRLRINLYQFRVNYTIIALLVLFLSLLYHPISMIVFLITFVGWMYLYIFRDEPLLVLNRTVDDRVVLVGMSLVTIFALILTHVWLNVFVAVAIGASVVCLHAAFRAIDDIDDQESPYGALFSVVDSADGEYSPV
ncbi:PRA1 family protein F2-like [Cornus florida]|uniref:PRA1 family protein F2-like n=1 Tax=Cornus florida TaxID=4283 RepID=UPI002899D241|nr:PRA1 family protein F2-like [Cornus florida]